MSEGGDSEGNWYTTITNDALDLPFGDHADWSDITRYGTYIQIVTSWAQLL